MTPSPPGLAMLTHPGRVRRVNEDACAARPEVGAYLVCDGMGGAAAGEVASQLALDTFLSALAASAPGSGPPARLEAAMQAANLAVYRYSLKSRTLRGMGTTLVAALVDGHTLWIAHVGDSRAYRLRAGALEQLTVDHSLVEEQIQAGVLTRLQAESSPVRNIITRAVGSQPLLEPELAHHAIEPGDLYLLASDGLTRELTDPEMAALLARPVSLETACQALVDAANNNGGADNITVLLLAFS